MHVISQTKYGWDMLEYQILFIRSIQTNNHAALKPNTKWVGITFEHEAWTENITQRVAP